MNINLLIDHLPAMRAWAAEYEQYGITGLRIFGDGVGDLNFLVDVDYDNEPIAIGGLYGDLQDMFPEYKITVTPIDAMGDGFDEKLYWIWEKKRKELKR